MSIRRLVLIVLAAVLLFGYFVLARFPAAHGLALLSYISQGSVTYSNASGTIWQGQAENIYISAQQQLLDLGKTDWRLQAWSLLIGRLNIEISAKQQKQVIKAQIQASSSKAQLNNVEVRVPIAKLMNFAPIPLPFQMEGELQLDLQSLALSKKVGVESISGNAVLQDVVVLMYEPLELGSYGARLSNQGDELVAQVSDIDATVELSGTMQANVKERSYTHNVFLKPKPAAHAMVTQALSMVANKQEDGRFHFKQNGHF